MRTLLHVCESCLDYITTADETASLSTASNAQKRFLASIVTATLQELYRLAPAAFGGQRGAQLGLPVTGSVGFTSGSRTVDLTAIAGDQRARTLQIGGVQYQIAITAAGVSELVEPFVGTTGFQSATVYVDAIEVESTYFNVIGNVELEGYGPLFAAPDRQTFLNLRNNYPLGDYGMVAGMMPRQILQSGQPWCYWVETGYIPSALGASNKLYLRFSPLPSGNIYRISYTLAYRPREVTVAELSDISTPVVLPMPGDFVDSIFLPCVLQRWTGSPWFRNDSARKEIERQCQVAQKILSNWSGQDHREVRMLVPAF